MSDLIESENFEDLYESGDEIKHDELISDVLKLNKKQNLNKPKRTEPTLQISEYNLIKPNNNNVININDLSKPLKLRRSRVDIKNKLRKLKKYSKTLPKPLDKVKADKIHRTIAYEKTRLEFDRWEPIITSNRVSINLNFPLHDEGDVEIKKNVESVDNWRLKTKLEQKIEEINRKPVEVYNINLEKKNKFPLTMKEMMEKRKESAKLRAYLSYKVAKARRQNKIKSKKFHRIQRREKIKKAIQEFEELQKTNPEEALKKLDDIEKVRIHERFSLRHKSTGKWAKNKQIRAKYDKESRQALAEQISLSRELTQKLAKNKDSSDEEDNEDLEDNTNENDDELKDVDEPNNPWYNKIKPNKEVREFVSNYKKYWEEKNKEICNGDESKENKGNNDEKQPSKDKILLEKKSKKKKIEKHIQTKKKDISDCGTTEWSVVPLKSMESCENEPLNIEHLFDKLENNLETKMNKLKKKIITKELKKSKRKIKDINKKIKKTKIDLSLPVQSKKLFIDDQLIESTGKDPTDESSFSPINSTIINNNININKNITREEIQIDPENFIKAKPTKLNTSLPDVITDHDDENNQNQQQLITEAFEDDDCINDFKNEKSNEIKKSKPKKLSLTLPGWGFWSGSNSTPSKRKQRRFRVKEPPVVPRKDENLQYVIINEKVQEKVREHQVSEVPFPFNSVKDYQASIRPPIGNTFIPQRAFKKLIKPEVTTKIGTIIRPMSKSFLLKK